jgi:hypothetical protein
MRLAGRAPGPWVGRAQKALLDAILDGDIRGDDPEAARGFLKEHPALLQGV